MNTENLKKEIKKVKVWHVALLCAGIFLAFAIIGSILIAAGGGWVAGQGMHLNIGDFSRVGPGTLSDVNDHGELDLAGVTSIVIKGISDDETLQAGSGKLTADLVGQCRSTGDRVRLDAHKNGSTVTVEVVYPPATNINTNVRLTVSIPVDYAGDLSVSTVSGDVHAGGLTQKLSDVKLHSVSGRITFDSAAFTSLKVDTTSGDIELAGILADTTVNSISGQVNLDYLDIAPTTVTTVSGDVAAVIPQSDDFAVDFGTISGTFTSNHPKLNVSSADHGFKSNAGGKTLLKVNTTSGDFKIEGK